MNKRFPSYDHRWLVCIILIGFLLRLLFFLKGATIYYGAGQEYTNGDSLSYINSFINLWERGHYTHEPLIEDASFGRLPGYPFFYGIHYILFGPKFVLYAIVFTQLLLDTAVIAIIYNMLHRWTGQLWPARIGAILYATYPFAIIWVTIIGTETLNTFCTVVWLSTITQQANSKLHYIWIGLLTVIAFYIREYMGILLPISIIYVLIQSDKDILSRLKYVLCIIGGFSCLYLFWPIRNYTNYERIVLVKPASAGYPNLREDMQAYLNWLHMWTNDNTTWVNKVLHNKPLEYPAEIFDNSKEEKRAYALTILAARCGSSFYIRRLNTHEYFLSQPPYFAPCNSQIAVGFDSLRRSYIKREPVKYYTAVPLANLSKAFFKSSKLNQETSIFKQLLQRTLFTYRTFLLLLGIFGLFLGYKKNYLWPISAYFLFIYLFISLVFRSLEMRYLLQADVLLLLPVSCVISFWKRK